MRIRKLSHTTYQHQYHIVWGTRYRRRWIKPYVKDEFVIYLKRSIARYPTLHLVSINTDVDHVHLQIEIPPNVAVSTAIQRLKAETSKPLKKRFPFLKKMYIDGSIWSVGYFSSTIGLKEEHIKAYIERQGKEDLGKQVKLKFE